MQTEDNPLLDYSEFYKTVKGSCKSCRRIECKTKLFTVYGHATESGLVEYRAESHMLNMDSERIHSVLYNLEYLKTHRSDLVRLLVLDEHFMNGRLVFCELRFPWPLQPRQYLFTQRAAVFHRQGNKVYLTLNNAVNADKVPKNIMHNVRENKRTVCVDTYYSHAAVIQDKEKTSLYMRYFENPGKNMPIFQANHIVRKSFMRYLRVLEEILADCAVNHRVDEK